MRRDERELLTLAALGEIRGADVEKLEALLARSAEARAEFEELGRLRSLVQAEAPRFAPGFEDRVIARIRPVARESAILPPVPRFADSLAFAFRRVAAAGVAIAFTLAALNVLRASGSLAGNPLEAALAWPAVTFESAYELEAGSLTEWVSAP
jgi:anti-sigma factor RsiW